MRGYARLNGLQAGLDDDLALLERAVTGAMQEATDGLKEELRDQTFRALGPKIAYAWQAEVYPRSATSLEPAGFVYSNAPKVIDFFSATKIITPIGAAFAIPTSNVPRRRGGRRMSPVEVEAHFNAELHPVPLRGGGLGLAIDVVSGLSSRRPGFRQATRGRTAQGRRARPVLMFVMKRTLSSRKLIDLDGPALRWAERVPSLIDKRMGSER